MTLEFRAWLVAGGTNYATRLMVQLFYQISEFDQSRALESHYGHCYVFMYSVPYAAKSCTAEFPQASHFNSTLQM